MVVVLFVCLFVCFRPFPTILAFFSSPGPFSSACDFSPLSLGLYPLRFVLPPISFIKCTFSF